ncbi:MAG TPA: phosphatase PAP2 family protein [Gemmatimonadaceae bacterium]|nr:phosphatase PAP2 family protein [Gemmatimonadaceae bacterium]
MNSHDPANRSTGDARPWWRQRWLTIAAGYSYAFLTGMVIAAWAERYGDWEHGTHWERQLMYALHFNLPHWLDELLLVTPWLGTNITLIPGVLLIVWWLWRRLKRPHLAMRLLIVQIGSYTLNPALKDLYGRPRPDMFPRRGWYGWSAYPSGHAIASIAVVFTVCAILHRERGWTWPYWVFSATSLMSLYSRIYLGVHWPIDVLAGVLVGVVWLFMTSLAFREKSRRVTNRDEAEPRLRSHSPEF